MTLAEYLERENLELMELSKTESIMLIFFLAYIW